MSFITVLVGFAGLILGGDWLVRGAVTVAQRFRVSPMIIGLTLVGFGTSTPELVTSVQAALAGSPGIAIGNVVGSNIANILLILGLAALLAPLTIMRAALIRDGSILIAASLLCVFCVTSGSLTPFTGSVFLAGLAGYLGLTIWYEKRPSGVALPPDLSSAGIQAAAVPLWSGARLLLAGLALTIFSAKLLVTGAISIAAALGVSEAIIGLTIVAVGTSLPELVTSIIAVRRGQADVAVGNVIGSNIFNILGILGVTSVILPLEVPEGIARFDIWIMFAATVALLVFARTGWRIGRREGLALMAGYAAYLSVLLARP